MTNAEIVKGIKCCMLIDYSCDECPYCQYGKTCNTMLYIDVIKFLPPITPDDCNLDEAIIGVSKEAFESIWGED